jgi:hypothetical protein
VETPSEISLSKFQPNGPHSISEESIAHFKQGVITLAFENEDDLDFYKCYWTQIKKTLPAIPPIVFRTSSGTESESGFAPFLLGKTEAKDGKPGVVAYVLLKIGYEKCFGVVDRDTVGPLDDGTIDYLNPSELANKVVSNAPLQKAICLSTRFKQYFVETKACDLESTILAEKPSLLYEAVKKALGSNGDLLFDGINYHKYSTAYADALIDDYHTGKIRVLLTEAKKEKISLKVFDITSRAYSFGFVNLNDQVFSFSSFCQYFNCPPIFQNFVHEHEPSLFSDNAIFEWNDNVTNQARLVSEKDAASSEATDQLWSYVNGHDLFFFFAKCYGIEDKIGILKDCVIDRKRADGFSKAVTSTLLERSIGIIKSGYPDGSAWGAKSLSMSAFDSFIKSIISKESSKSEVTID